MSGPARTSPARLHNNSYDNNATAGSPDHVMPPQLLESACCRLPRLMQLDTANLHPTGRRTLPRRAGQASPEDLRPVHWQLELDNNCERTMNLTLTVGSLIRLRPVPAAGCSAACIPNPHVSSSPVVLLCQVTQRPSVLRSSWHLHAKQAVTGLVAWQMHARQKTAGGGTAVSVTQQAVQQAAGSSPATDKQPQPVLLSTAQHNELVRRQLTAQSLHNVTCCCRRGKPDGNTGPQCCCDRCAMEVRC